MTVNVSPGFIEPLGSHFCAEPNVVKRNYVDELKV